jgi:squalene monooxygenase
LHKLGLGSVLEGIDATPVEGYCVISGGRQVGVPYPDMEKMVRGEMEDGVGGSVDPVSSKKGRGRKGSIMQALTGGSGEKAGEEEKMEIMDPSSSEWHVPSRSGRKEGRSFHHGRLISSLRSACFNAGPNITVLEGTVRELVYCEHTNRVIGVSAAFKSLSSGEEEEKKSESIVRKIYSPIIIVADGCFSKFRTLPNSRVPKPQTRSHFVGLVLKDADLPMKYHGNVFLTPSGPVLLYQIGDKAEETRMLVDVKGKLPSVGDGSLKVSQ